MIGTCPKAQHTRNPVIPEAAPLASFAFIGGLRVRLGWPLDCEHISTDPFQSGIGKTVKTQSTESTTSPLSAAVAAMIRSNGYRCFQSNLAASGAISAVSPVPTPPRSVSRTGKPSRWSDNSGHFRIRTFWPISNRLTKLTKRYQLGQGTALHPDQAAARQEKSRPRLRVWWNPQSLAFPFTQLVFADRFQKTGDVLSLSLRIPRRKPDCGSGIGRTAGLLPSAITASSPRNAALINLESRLIAGWTENCMQVGRKLIDSDGCYR